MRKFWQTRESRPRASGSPIPGIGRFRWARTPTSFPREAAYGFHLNIPAGTSVRFEPGDSREVELTEYGGDRTVYGFNGLVNGPLDERRSEALQKARDGGFGEVPP